MAKTVVELRVGVSMRWWVRPYLWLATGFAWCFAPFLDPDDGRLDAWIERQAGFIVRHGVVFCCEAED